MPNIKLTIQYEGTNYIGWQKQLKGDSIQGEIEKAIKNITGEEVNLIASGRTDSGVHALGQVANFLTNSSIPPDKFKYALNTKLPEDISIIESEEVPCDFHARYDAIGKRYMYLIYNNPIRNPIYRRFVYHIPYPLDYENMKEGVKYLIGTHDFAAFMASNSSVENTIRTINNAYLSRKNELILFRIEGNGFLYNMVRIIVGTLIEIGRGKLKPYDISHIIESKNRKLAGPTASSQGLFLERVYY